jgi:hypothetical protein
MDLGLQIVHVNGNGINIRNKSLTDSAQSQSQGQGQRNLVGMARHVGEVSSLDVEFAGKKYHARG